MRHAFVFAVLIASVGTTPTALSAQEYDDNATFDYYYYPYEGAPSADQVGYSQGFCSGPSGGPISVMMWGRMTPWSERVYVSQCPS